MNQKPSPPRRRVPLDPWTKDPRDPLEQLARLAGGGTFRLPVAGRGGVAETTVSDVAGALGLIRNRFAGLVALAVATRDVAKVGAITTAAFEAVMKRLHDARIPGLNLRDGATRHRVRMTLVSATSELIAPETKKPMKLAAQVIGMRYSTYREVHEVAAAFLSNSLDGARVELRRALFSEGRNPAIPSNGGGMAGNGGPGTARTQKFPY